MRRRLLAVVAVLGLLAGGCGFGTVDSQAFLADPVAYDGLFYNTSAGVQHVFDRISAAQGEEVTFTSASFSGNSATVTAVVPGSPGEEDRWTIFETRLLGPEPVQQGGGGGGSRLHPRDFAIDKLDEMIADALGRQRLPDDAYVSNVVMNDGGGGRWILSITSERRRASAIYERDGTFVSMS